MTNARNFILFPLVSISSIPPGYRIPKENKTNRSISSTLTRLLILTVVIVSLTTAAIIYAFVSKREHAQLEAKAEQFITSMDDVLEIPLWNLDRETTRKIARAYANDELFEHLKIEDSLGIVVFHLSRDRGAPVIRKTADIHHNGELVGHISMAYTTKNLAHKNHNILLFGLGILAMVICALAFVTGLFFKRILQNLFARLNAISDAYALDTEISMAGEMPYTEFQPLINILKDMRDKLNLQFLDIQAAEKKYRSIFENAVEGIYQSTPEGRLIDVNPAMAEMLGYDSPRQLLQSVSDIGRELYVDPDLRKKYVQLTREQGVVSNFEAELLRRDGNSTWVLFNSRPVYDDTGELVLIEGVAKNITEQKEEENRRKLLEAQLLHSQKMDSVGKLAGGVAHDFNNMLSIIMGYSDILLESISPDAPEYEDLVEIKSAAKRSADLTRQLLAFARKQTASPRSLDLNTIIQEMLKMLERLLGEEIRLNFVPGGNIGMVYMDPSQIDQILVNLCINARDAIDGSGDISIKTEPAFLGPADCRDHPDAIPGAYTLLSIKDNGSGMDQATLKQIFEPFFTTKGIRKGTGLGLSTVYGIIRQNMGNIFVDSEPGRGSTFRIYLPVHEGNPDELSSHEKTDASFSGDETVLLVEDESALLTLTRRTLEHLGYTVLAAASPGEAIEIASACTEEIHLLMTDVIMPEMTGRELSDLLLKDRPELRCLYMSGYTSDILAPKGVLGKGIHFIQKPFPQKILAEKIRGILS